MSSQDARALPEQQSRRMSVPHLVMGLVYIGFAGSWVLHRVGVIESVQVRWLLPLVLVVAGAAGLIASFMRVVIRTRATDRKGDHPGDQPGDQPGETFVTDERL